MSDISSLTGNPWRQPLWIAFLIAASIAFSLGFACAAPLAAFGAAAALTMPRRPALLLIGGVWLANQLVGFCCLGYPTDPLTLTWGAVLGVVAVLAYGAAAGAARHLTPGLLAAVCAFIAAFVAYEVTLYLVSALALGGAEIYTVAIQGRILGINAAAFLGLLLLSRIGRVSGIIHPVALGQALR